MKIKAILLAALFVTGLVASLAFAKEPKHGQTTSTTTTAGTTTTTPNKPKCDQVELKGNATAGSVTFTVTKANKRRLNLVGTSVTLTVPANARIKAKACSAAGGALTLRDLHVTVPRGER
jgi:heme-binding NEAT domain protein